MKKIEFVKFKDAPNSWFDRCSDDGYEKYTNQNGQRVYIDIDIAAEDLGFRPCAKCGEYPTLDGDDACIANLGSVMNACCGHGKNKGYIQFDNGITIRGHFEIEKNNNYPSDKKHKNNIDINNKQYLLHYQAPKKGFGTFAWFYTEEELQEFIDNNNVHIVEAIKVVKMEIISS